MYVAMATAVRMDYTLPLKQGNSFQMLLWTRHLRMFAICAVYAIAYTCTSIYKNIEFSWNSAPNVFVLASYVNTMVLTSERH